MQHSFDNSVSKLLATVYPKYDWKMWLFGRCDVGEARRKQKAEEV